jgi:S1-C subfamily serine protease
MITRTRESLDMVKIVDFGIARAMWSDTQRVTRTGSLVGTPEFMSPEQFAGDVLDSRSDLYSLALVAFNMLTGASAYPSGTSKDNLIVRLTQPPRRLHDVKDLPWPEELQTTFDKALASDPSARHASVLEFSRDMTAAIAAMPASQTGELYLSALATALEARAVATPVRSHTPVPVLAPSLGEMDAEVPNAGVQPRRSPGFGKLVGAAAALIVVALGSWRAIGGGPAATLQQTPLDSAQASPVEPLADSTSNVGGTATPEEEVFARARSSVAWVTGSGGSGLAFLVNNSGLLLTATHLVRGDSLVSVMINDTLRVRARVVLSDSARPVSVLAMAPGRCRGCAVLPLVATDPASVPAVGTPVLAIGASRVARPRMITGAVKSADLRRISTTATTNSAESGAPVVALSGEVVAMNIFPAGGRALEIHAVELRAALLSAEAIAGAPGFIRVSDSLLPVRPRTPFPAAPITALAAVENLDLLKRYRSARGDFEVFVMTPPVMGWRDARAKSASEKLRAGARAGKPPLSRVDPVQGWPGWDSCIRERCAVVAINVVPDRTPFLYHKPAELVNFSRGDVSGLTLLRDGVPVEPIEMSFFPAVLNAAEHAEAKKAVFSQGIALYRAKEFAPSPTGAISKYTVVVTDAARGNRLERIDLDAATIQSIINDFAPYGLAR